MFRIKSRRARIRLFSFILAAFVVSAGLAITGFTMAYKLRMNIEYSYERSLSELSSHMNNINLALEKAQYASTTSQLVGLASQIRTESTAAKIALSQISVSDVNFASTSKFISQTGDYANSLSHQFAENKKLSNDQLNSLNSMYTNSKKLSLQVNDLVSDVQNGRLTLFKSEKAVDSLDKKQTQQVSTVESGFQNIEDNMSGLPSLIYDGPFSDNVLKKQPDLTRGKPAVSREAARGAAASFLSVDAKQLSDDGETAGNLPTYNFKTGTKNIYVSKHGGYIVRMLDSRAPAASKLSTQDAVNKVNAFLKSQNLNNMAQTYYLKNNNICVINFAFMQDNVTCYTDLMKVGIALDNGEVISFDATGYIMNHKTRSLPAVVLKQSSAKALLNPKLTVKKVSLALIPKNGTDETLCYEFKCTADKGARNIIDYFNVTNGVEEQILILKQTPGGTLAM